MTMITNFFKKLNANNSFYLIFVIVLFIYISIPFMPFTGFQEVITPIMEGINDLHNFVMFFLVGILTFVIYILYIIIIYFYSKIKEITIEAINFRGMLLRANSFVHNLSLEIVWTVTPAIILIFIIIPSFALLYSMDEVIVPFLIIKVIGHQWYWNYEYSECDFSNAKKKSWLDSLNNDLNFKETLKTFISFENKSKEVKPIKFDSYMINEADLQLGDLRLLEVDNEVVVPKDSHIKVLITAADVLHSWAVPALGVKVDAVPGRLSQATVFLKTEGTFYGQCSEICGVNHGFMPIVIKSVNMEDFIEWYNLKSLEEIKK